MFGSDLSFIPGLLGVAPPDYPWTNFFRTTIWSIFTLNSHLPALFVMFLCVLFVKNYYDSGKLAYLLLFAILGYSAFGFKSSMGTHIMGVAFLTGIISVLSVENRKVGILLSVVSALTILVITVDVVFVREGVSNITLSVEPFNNFYKALKKLNISNLSMIFYPIIFLLYGVGMFGTRLISFYLLRDVLKKKEFNPTVIFLTIFIISGFIISETVFIGSPNRRINNANWFSVQSLMAAWLLLSYSLLRLGSYGKKIWFFIIAVVLFSVPTTVQFLNIRFDYSYYTVNSNAMEVVRYLDTTPPESVILHPLNVSGPSLASNLTGRQSVISVLRAFASGIVGEQERNERIADVLTFFNLSAETGRQLILQKYKVNYVYAPSSYAEVLNKESVLIQILKNSQYVLYRVNTK